MENDNKDKLVEYKNSDEIDLVDILAVLIKRKWTIIILLVLSFLISYAYVKLHKGKSINYSVSYNITLPEEYTIDIDYILNKKNADANLFIDELNQKISQYKINNGNSINISANLDTKTNIISINISADNKEKSKEASLYVYKLYRDYEKEILNRNKNIFDIAQNSLTQEIKQKQAIIDMLMKNLNKDNLLSKNQNINGTILYVIDFLSNNISDIKRIKLLNQDFQLNKGKIEVSDESNHLILTDTTVSQLYNYIKAEIPSKKKRLLPIIVSVFLALFVGIFLAFAIEFFSREDVKKRLKEASKR